MTQPIVEDIWREKYRYGDEASLDETYGRVIRALTRGESVEFQKAAFAAGRAREILPAGRILAGIGTDKRVTSINCFVSPDIQDSMQTEPERPGVGIMEALAQAAYTQQMGGGIGMDFSTIRPRGAVVKRTRSVSSGVLPFMDMWDSMCATIRSSGSRRGAMMATLGVWHPDVEEFVEAKQQPGRLTNFNVSVLVTDAFMEAVREDGKWDLFFWEPPVDVEMKQLRRNWTVMEEKKSEVWVYKTIRARELWEKITEATYVHAEPGVIFIDRVNEQNNLNYCEYIHATNPCGEQPLPANGDCNLGHTNLAVMVSDPFGPDAQFNFRKLRYAARIMTRLLDNVLDVTLWPTEAQAEEARLKRRIGLGFTGLGSALQQLGIPYGSEVAVDMTRRIAREQALAAYRESIELAKERGAFPLFNADEFCAAPFIGKLPIELREAINEFGIRNGVLLTVAPTGTTSLVIGNVSSGVEPVFAHSYRRRVRANDGELSREYDVFDYGYLKYCEKHGCDPATDTPFPAVELLNELCPPGFVTADELTVEQHLQMAAAAQEWVDAAISKTINCPTSMTLEEFQQVYSRAYALGMKGCTTYRPDPRSGRGAILEATPEGAPDVGREGPELLPDDKIPMQEVVEGRRYRVKWPTEDCSYYVVITDYVDTQGRRRPFELFISTKSERHSEWVKAFSLLVTAIFRREGDPSFVVEELKSVFSASGGTWIAVPWADRPKLAPSLVAAIGLRIEEHMRWLGLIEGESGGEGRILLSEGEPKASAWNLMPAQELLDVCNHCGARAVIYSEGCATCHACGRSDCA